VIAGWIRVRARGSILAIILEHAAAAPGGLLSGGTTFKGGVAVASEWK
jgi:hypothetical protein